ncbi:MAG: DM13 domain-containing protein [Leptolyngbyaceae cyanobacterium SM1_1_3]|nr:DM13 domain-containing protein [Leptolyngbyaceae cyanobacterium SM1_1_3]NJN04487.1 DM13 domain-containing protein [Leptolyngbyaceae cyanobacterium RM1_1_2]NJO10670.1 DM13 domain-containing protein [Leptolyngbyaceae cyanobacterium SL_1_1]
MRLISLTALGLTTALLLSNSAYSAPQSSEARPVELAQAAPLSNQFVTVDQSKATTGSVRIVTENGQRYLEFDQQFSTARGPDVEVVLYRGATIPGSIAESDYTAIAQLQSFQGSQRYAIPESINLAEYGSVGIWCRRFNVTFGYAAV